MFTLSTAYQAIINNVSIWNNKWVKPTLIMIGIVLLFISLVAGVGAFIDSREISSSSYKKVAKEIKDCDLHIWVKPILEDNKISRGEYRDIYFKCEAVKKQRILRGINND